MTTFQLGPYTVTQRHEADLYRVFLRTVLIGKCYSRPNESDCEWLHKQQREQTGYAYSAAKLPKLAGKTMDECRNAADWHGRKKHGGRLRKADAAQSLAEAIDS
jgi:hypothetical protein